MDFKKIESFKNGEKIIYDITEQRIHFFITYFNRTNTILYDEVPNKNYMKLNCTT